MDDYFILDIETCPFDLDRCKELDEEDRKKLLNPIDSKIIAIGIKYEEESIIIKDKEEKEILEGFWDKWKEIKKIRSDVRIVGFNIKNFDLPFLVSKSFIHNVVIVPFLVKDVIDLREKINVYKIGPSRGTLKEYGELITGLRMDIDGKDIIQLCIDENYEKIIEYLKNDLEITDKMYKRMKETKILYIDRW